MDLGIGVGQREHDGVRRPWSRPRRPPNRFGPETPMKTSAPDQRLAQGAREAARRWCSPRSRCGARRRRSRRGGSRPCGRTATMWAAPWACSSWMIAWPAAPTPEIDDLDVADLLADDPQRVDQGGEHHDGGAVLVVVEDRDVELVAQPALDLEAARRGDVLEVDPAVDRGERLDDGDDLLGVLGVQADRPGVDAGELLEQRGLALHHRQGRGRADVAEPEHRRAVGDHRDRVALDRQPAGVLGVARRWPGRPAPRRGCRPGTGRRGSSAGPSARRTACRRGAAGTSGR